MTSLELTFDKNILLQILDNLLSDTDTPSIQIGAKRNYVLNKYLLFEIIGSVFSTFQAIQLLAMLSRKSR